MTLYPNQIDTDNELPRALDNITEIDSNIINSIRNSVIAIEKAIGINPQGSEQSLASRINIALNPDGTFTSSALSASGLVSLPINNPQIANNAAIAESKLDLDYSTSDLNNGINSNDTDIATLQDSLARDIVKLARHVTGQADRHSATHINHVLADGYGSGIGSTVSTALNYLSGRFDEHVSATNTFEHNASAINYVPKPIVPGIENIILDDNVQDAIETLEDELELGFITHSKVAHISGLSDDGYVQLGGQANPLASCLMPAKYMPNSGPQFIKAGLINSSAVKSKGINLLNINSASNVDSVRFTVTIGTATRTIEITNLFNAAYPVGNEILTTQGLADYLNAAFANTAGSSHFPLTAYADNDGELIIQHNIARNDCTIMVEDSATNSAVSALGFSDIKDIIISRINNKELYVNGKRFTELRTISSASLTQGSLSSIVNLGVDVTATGLSLRANQLLHVFNHTVNDANGTYKIIGLTSGTEIQLAENLAAGNFQYVIYDDTFNLNGVTSLSSFDLSITEERELTAILRSTEVFAGLEGVRILGVSQDSGDLDGYLILDTSSSGDRLLTFEASNGILGEPITLVPGELGVRRLYLSNRVSFVDLLVFSISLVDGINSISFDDANTSNNLMMIASTHHNGASSIETPLDSRPLGLTGTRNISSVLNKEKFDKDISNFHISGVIRGFDPVSFTTSGIVLGGGEAYIDGRFVKQDLKEISFNGGLDASTIYNVVLTKDGLIKAFKDASGQSDEKSLETIFANPSEILLSRFSTNVSSQITVVTDNRLFINNIENKLELTVDPNSSQGGLFRSVAAANVYATTHPFLRSSTITVISDLEASSVGISANQTLIFRGNVTLVNSLSLSTNSRIICMKDLTIVAGGITLQDGASLEVRGHLLLESTTGSVGLFDNSSLTLHSSFTSSRTNGPAVLLSGSNILIQGTRNSKVPFEFAESIGITIDAASGNRQNIAIRNLAMVQSNTTINGLISISKAGGGATQASNIIIDNCSFRQEAGLSDVELESASNRQAIATINNAVNNINNILIKNCYFTNVATCINFIGTGLTVVDCVAESFGRFLASTNASFASEMINVRDCKVTQAHTHWFNFAHSPKTLTIHSNYFAERMSITSTPTFFNTAGVGGCEDIIISNNLFENMVCEDFIVSKPADNVFYFINNIVTNPTITNRLLFLYENSFIIGNYIFNGVAYGTPWFIQDRGVCSSNVIIMEDLDGSMFFYGSVVANNYITHFNSSAADSLTFSNSATYTAAYNNICNNVFVGHSIGLVGCTECLFSNNKVTNNNSSRNYALRVDDGSYNITNNVIFSIANSGSGPTAVNLEAGTTEVLLANNFISSAGNSAVDAAASTDCKFVISNNIISSGGAVGISVGSNSLVQGNEISGTVSSTDIEIGSGITDVFVHGNLLNGTGGTRVFINDSAPERVLVYKNKNATERLVFSPFSGQATGSWTVSLGGYSSSNIGSKLYIPLLGLPVGARLDTLNLFVNNAGSLGSGRVRVYTRNSAAFSTSTISSFVNFPAGVSLALSVPITASTYIRNNVEYFLEVEVINAVNIQIGQVVASLVI